MEDSVLNSVKAIIGINEEDTAFDKELIIHINSVLSVLRQIGLSCTDKLLIHGSEETWADFIVDNDHIEEIKTYIGLRVRKIFDPPINQTTMTALNETISELEFRLNISMDTN